MSLHHHATGQCPACGALAYLAREHFANPEPATINAELLTALMRLASDSMYKDHPEASDMAWRAIEKAGGAP
jgi:hypothetical protein